MVVSSALIIIKLSNLVASWHCCNHWVQSAFKYSGHSSVLEIRLVTFKTHFHQKATKNAVLSLCCLVHFNSELPTTLPLNTANYDNLTMNCIRFGVSMSVIMGIQVFWDMMLCGLVSVFHSSNHTVSHPRRTKSWAQIVLWGTSPILN